MKHCLFAAALVIVVHSSAQAEEKSNPLKQARVGDYLTYKVTTKALGQSIEVTLKQTVSRIDDKELTLKTDYTLAGETVESKEMKIDLTKPYDPVAAALQSDKNGKFTRAGEGTETLRIGGKSYVCSYVRGRVTETADGKKIDTQMKLWFCDAVPLTGMVKIEMKSSEADGVMELIGSGKGK